jgi:hypothetical protein
MEIALSRIRMTALAAALGAGLASAAPGDAPCPGIHVQVLGIRNTTRT